MKLHSIETLFVRGGVAALFAAGVVWPAGAQVVPAAPVRSVVKDTVLVRMIDGSRFPDSLRVLIRAFDTEPFSSMASARMAQQLEAMIRMGFGPGVRFDQAAPGRSPFIVITGPDGLRQAGIGSTRGWIGLTTGGVHNEWSNGHFVQYLDYPPIVSVERPSPAQAAGIVPGDTLVAYDGVDVVAHPIDIAQLLTPDKKVAVTVRRDGESKAFTVTVARMPNTFSFSRRLAPGEVLPGMPGMPSGEGGRSVIVAGRGSGPIAIRPVPGASGQLFYFEIGALGASLSDVGPDLARAWKIEPGVLVNEVPEGTPAYNCGLRAGDVIVSVGGQPVTSVNEVRTLAMLRGENRSVTLQIIRDKKPRSIIVK
jgi:membrane-associated protease RseP (regulator of RpoE activity)